MERIATIGAMLGEKTGNSLLGIAPSTQDFVTHYRGRYEGMEDASAISKSALSCVKTARVHGDT
jgi:hypothetical protein